MITLFSVPGTASTVAHAALLETGAPFELVQVTRRNRDEPPELKQVNRRGRVPALLDGDCRMSETAAILLHLGDRFPESALAPAVGTRERADYYRWIAYLTSTLHAAFTRWYTKNYLADKELARILSGAAEPALLTSFDLCDAALAGREYLAGRFTGADLLLHMLASPSWTLELPVFASRPHLAAHHARVNARPAVQEMLAIHARDKAAGL